VPDIDAFTVLSKGQTVDKVRANYETLQQAGVPLENQVLLLSIGPFCKDRRTKKSFVEAGFSLESDPLLQLYQYWHANAKKALEEGPVAVEALYRDIMEKGYGLKPYLKLSQTYAISRILMYMKTSLRELESCRPGISLIKKHLEKGPEQYFIEIGQKLETEAGEVPGSFFQALEDSVTVYALSAQRYNTHGVPIYPSQDELAINERIAFIETPCDPGSYLREALDGERLTKSHPGMVELRNRLQFESAVSTESLRLITDHRPFEEVLTTFQGLPDLIITDVYAFDLFPEIEQWDISVVNKDVDVRNLKLM